MKSKKETIEEYTERALYWNNLTTEKLKEGNFDEARSAAENVLITIDNLRYVTVKFEI
jgi:hypothetical protein